MGKTSFEISGGLGDKPGKFGCRNPWRNSIRNHEKIFQINPLKNIRRNLGRNTDRNPGISTREKLHTTCNVLRRKNSQRNHWLAFWRNPTSNFAMTPAKSSQKRILKGIPEKLIFNSRDSRSNIEKTYISNSGKKTSPKILKTVPGETPGKNYRKIPKYIHEKSRENDSMNVRIARNV